MQIIGFMGAAGSGKDTLANHMLGTFPGLIKFGFAYPLKHLCCELFGWHFGALNDDAAAQVHGFETALEYKESPSGHVLNTFLVGDICRGQGLDPDELVREETTIRQHVASILKHCTSDKTRREIMQLVGTECFRAINPAHWSDRARRELITLGHSPDAPEGALITDMRFPNEADMIRELGGCVVLIEREGGPEGTAASGHSSEQVWRDITPDHKLTARWGDLNGLRLKGEILWGDIADLWQDLGGLGDSRADTA